MRLTVVRSVLLSILYAALSACGDGGSGISASIHTQSTTYATAGYPFQALPLNSGDVLVSVTTDGKAGSSTGVEVFTPSFDSLAAYCVNDLPANLTGKTTMASNLSLFPNNSDVAMGMEYPGAIFYQLTDLLTTACTASGYVLGQGSTTVNNTVNNAGTLNVLVTPDNMFAFVANEAGIAAGSSVTGNIGVVAIQQDASGNFTSGTSLIGQIPTRGSTIAGIKLSPDGSRLYVTSEVGLSRSTPAGSTNPLLYHNGCVQSDPTKPTLSGILTVIDVKTAETTPTSSAILTTVAAGCSPTRMAESANGKLLWVSARGDNRILGFDTSLLDTKPDQALIVATDSGGIAPVGISLFRHDQFLAVANSNRFAGSSSNGNLAILDVSSPINPSVAQTVPAGGFPREVSVGPDDSTLYLTNFLSETLQVIQTTIQ